MRSTKAHFLTLFLLSIVSLQSDALTARVQLYRAMGGGWSPAQLAEAEAGEKGPMPGSTP